MSGPLLSEMRPHSWGPSRLATIWPASGHGLPGAGHQEARGKRRFQRWPAGSNEADEPRRWAFGPHFLDRALGSTAFGAGATASTSTGSWGASLTSDRCDAASWPLDRTSAPLDRRVLS